MSDITSQTLTSLVKNIKEKKLSSEEVTKAFVDRSEKSKELNAYITEDFSNAIYKAKKLVAFILCLSCLLIRKVCPTRLFFDKVSCNP